MDIKREQFMRQFAQCKEQVAELRRLFPEFFHADGRPIVAELRMLPPLQRSGTGKDASHDN